LSGSLWLVALSLAFASEVIAAQSAQPTEVSVLAHAVSRGNLLERDDFATEQRSPAQARNALSIDDAVGREAARTLPAGMVVRPADVIAPRLVRRGESVSINIRSGGLVIATQGRALGSGGAGDHVRVVAVSTNRTLDGAVEGPGAVRVTAP
jgi:flagella basal body P-ring formation protein FlgA